MTTQHKLGTDLSPKQQAEVKSTYVHRFTGEYKPTWARTPRPDGSAYPVQFADDLDWLANTTFPVRKDGKLTSGDCRSRPTWPANPELQRPSE